jgi:choline dehydrogenase-like flavoprotein
MAPKNKGGVVDHQLRVYGTKNLRVVDASIFPYIPSGNLNAPTGMVAWRASTFIVKEHEPRFEFLLRIPGVVCNITSM